MVVVVWLYLCYWIGVGENLLNTSSYLLLQSGCDFLEQPTLILIRRASKAGFGFWMVLDHV